MSGNFAIKGGRGGQTPNGKCHLKFPFWLFEPFPKHIKEIHHNVKDVQCQKCDMTFKRREYLKKHERKIHPVNIQQS